MYLKKLFSSCKIFNILFVTVIISIYLLSPNNSYSKEEQSNTTPPTTTTPQEVTINGVKYSPTPPAKTQATQSTLKISDLIVGGYVSAGYLVDLGSPFKSLLNFSTYPKNPTPLETTEYVNEFLRPNSTDGDAFYIKIGYQSIMAGVEFEVRNKSRLSSKFESKIDPNYSINIYNQAPEFGFNYYLDFLSSKKYVLAALVGISTTRFSSQTLSDGKFHQDAYQSLNGKYGILYRQFVYKNIGLEVSWYGMSRWSKHDVTGWSYINGGYVETTYNNSEFSIGIVYDF